MKIPLRKKIEYHFVSCQAISLQQKVKEMIATGCSLGEIEAVEQKIHEFLKRKRQLEVEMEQIKKARK